MDEQWKAFGSYQISNLGRIKGPRGWILRPCTRRDGYLQVAIREDGKHKNMLAHRLVAMAWIPNLENKNEVDHINRVKTDNRVENLRWATRSENVLNRESGKSGHAYIGDATMGKNDYYRIEISILKINKYFNKEKYTLEEVIAERDDILEKNSIVLL